MSQVPVLRLALADTPADVERGPLGITATVREQQ